MPASEIRYTAAEDYIAAIRQNVRVRTDAEEVSIDSLPGRILADDLFAPIDLPLHATSLVDGYAVRSEDTVAASEDHPVILRFAGKVELETIPAIRIHPNEACYIPTGGILPKGADAAVKIEEILPSTDGASIRLKHPIPSGEHMTPAGQDFKKGQTIFKRGRRLRSEDLALLAALQIWRAKTIIPPRVAILSIGDELTDRFEEVTSTRKFAGISAAIAHLVSEAGGKPILLGIAPDDQALIEQKIRQGLGVADAVLTIGGTSKGVKDFVADSINRSGRPGLLFHGIDIVPGRVSGLGVVNGKPIVMMPGLIQSTVAAFYFIALPAIRRLCGLEPEPSFPQIRVPMGEGLSFKNPSFRKLFFVRLVDRGGETVVRPLSKPGEASLMKPIVDSDGFVLLPAGSTSIRRGARVAVSLLHGW